MLLNLIYLLSALAALGICAAGGFSALTWLWLLPLGFVGCFVLCLLALLLQLAELTHRAAMGDTSAILDTVCAVFLAAATLSAGTVLLNTLARFPGRK